MKKEELIQKQKPISQSRWHGKVMFPIMEKELYERFIDTRKEEKQIKRLRFNTKAKRIMCETYPEHVQTFKMSARRYTRFCNNFVSQYPNFMQRHWEYENKRKQGTYTSRDLANMDQILLPFVLDDNKT